MGTSYGNSASYKPESTTHKFRVRLDLSVSGSGTTSTVTATLYHQRDTKVKLASSAWQYSLTGVSSAKYPASDVSSATGAVKLLTRTYTYVKLTRARTVYFTAKLKRLYSPDAGATSTVTASVTIPALAKYTISYDANEGAGAPSSQTKTQGTALTLSSVVPTRTGYTFAGWSTVKNGAVAYSAGARYSADASATLWAVWKGISYNVAFEPNGGAGIMATQAMTYGTPTALRKNSFTRQGYSFCRWAFVNSSGTTVLYADGASVSDLTTTAGATVTLTAQWTAETAITGVSAVNCDADGTEDDDGTCALITARYTYGNQQIDAPSSAVCAIITAPDGAAVGDPAYSTGTVTWLVTGITPDTASSFAVTITGGGSSARSATVKLPAVSRVIDVKAGGKGLGLGMAAPDTGLAVGYDAGFKGTLDVAGAATLNGGFSATGDMTYITLPSVDIDTTPSESVTPAMVMLDKDGANVARFGVFHGSSNRTSAEMIGYDAAGSANYLALGFQNGSASVALAYPNAWLTSLKAGGEILTTASDVISAGSGITISEVRYYRWGRIATLKLAWSYSSAISVPTSGNITDVTVGTVVSGKRPLAYIFGHSGGNNGGAAWYSFSTAGVIKLAACESTGGTRTIAKGTSFDFYTVYFLA
jgi:uncharacterized repeat protein (TIGR02543 family)